MNGVSTSRRPTIRLKCLVLGAAGAGKTSLLRRYFHRRFHSERVPTVGADFYTCRVRHPDDGATTISLQMWDTPGRERFALDYPPNNNEEPSYYSAATFSPDFFRQADAILLVYDTTSSTSFKQLLKWYADLKELQQKRPVAAPILVVGSKRDLLGDHPPEKAPVPPTLSKRRDVMGLSGIFRGNDFRYEYQVTPADHQSTTKLSQYNPGKRMEMSSYLVNRENWTDDWSYLASVLNSEDQSNPDRDMVLLWCRRNGLDHCEVSALTGEGVEEAVKMIIRQALRATDEQQQPSPEILRQPRQRLDFHERYAGKEEPCCEFFLRPIRGMPLLLRKDSM